MTPTCINVYSPFGMNIGNLYPSPFGFSSECKENETNLIYFNYRYYDLLGKWISYDPLDEFGFKKSNHSITDASILNLYSININDCINRIDKLGLISRWKDPEDIICADLSGIAKAICVCFIRTLMKSPQGRKSKCLFASDACTWSCNMDFDLEDQKTDRNLCLVDCQLNYIKCLRK